MKILIYIESLRGGGAARVASLLANHWAVAGYQIYFVTLSCENNDFYHLNKDVVRIPLNLKGNSNSFLSAISNNVQRIYGLLKVIKEFEPEVCISFQETSNIHLGLTKLFYSKSINLGTIRNYPPSISTSKLSKIRRYLIYRLLDKIVVQTQTTKDWLKKIYPVNQIFIIPNPIILPLENVEPLVQPKITLPNNKKVILSVGTLRNEKGFDLLIRSVGSISMVLDDWIVVILGEGKERVRLQNLIFEYGLQGKVKLVGKVGNIADWYDIADIYVLSSRTEGFPNSLVEAMAYGVSSISFDCKTGPSEIINHGVNGVLVPANDVITLSKEIKSLVENQNNRESYSMNAKKIKKQLAFDNISNKWEILFSKKHDV
jgi:glycosyltransferase involved in cell wall biosynthesis